MLHAGFAAHCLEIGFLGGIGCGRFHLGRAHHHHFAQFQAQPSGDRHGVNPVAAQHEAAAGAQHTRALAQHLPPLFGQVQRAHQDHAVEAGIGAGQVVHVGFDQGEAVGRRVGGPLAGDFGQHAGGEVNADDATARCGRGPGDQPRAHADLQQVAAPVAGLCRNRRAHRARYIGRKGALRAVLGGDLVKDEVGRCRRPTSPIRLNHRIWLNHRGRGRGHGLRHRADFQRTVEVLAVELAGMGRAELFGADRHDQDGSD